ncbi:Ig-like domain-containing protein [Paraneptunicella aestuarii]|uniref:Ig-like domain-containing protein n=1 Tax=Paraneptunicella aestuarii TaxID=2831148 RepID=UPI001E477200|nr:Ig-like domain-containing protein [Paraneptunicella aestuarii]UAA40320.1 Ig-like domain-containing protein [Paraneptunicella aestuarii]
MVAQQHISLLVKSLVIGVYILLLSACGGGGSISRDQTDQGNNTTQVLQIALEIAERDSGSSSNQLSSSTPLTVTATVTDSNGNAINDELVTFSFTQTDLAFFEPANGTALTGTDGVATIDITVGEQAGAGKVVATLESGETAEIGFVSEGGGTLVTDVPATLDLYTSAIQLSSSGSEEIELIALVKNAQNVLLEGVTVSFSSDSGELQIIQATSGTDGTARAILTSQNNPENRTFTVSAEVGSLRQEVDIDVVGTEVRINGPASVILNDTAEITIVVADSDGNGIPNKQVQLSSANGNGLSNTNPRTDETGQITVNYTALNSGVDVITASSLGAVGSTNISVQQDQFSFSTVPSDDIELNTNASLKVTWLREGVPFTNGTVTFSTTRGTLNTTTGTTDANGQVSVSINSTNAGKATVLAQGVDNVGEIVNARADIEFIATQVDNILIEASPSSIGPDGQKSTITAVLRDPLGNLVKGKTINFTADDVSGGSISPATVVTDSNGLATTVYTSNTVTSEDAIIITATEPDSNIQASTSLTVGDRALFISLGTGNKIESPDEASYLKKFTVFVTDANSNPVDGANLTISGTPVKYSDLLSPNAQPGDPNYGVIRPAFYKGYWAPFPSADAFEYWVPVKTIGCANEDVDDDAILDPNEDTNGDGNISPGNIIAIDGNVTTDDNGQAILNLRYPKTFAAWVTVKITAKTLVAGSESRVSQFYTLSASAEDVSIESTTPNTNPYGDGRYFVEDPNNPGTFIDDGSALTCTNSL